jgi:hypothetical protein
VCVCVCVCSSTCRETADIISHMFKNNDSEEFVLIKINIIGSLEMLSKDTYLAAGRLPNCVNGLVNT